MSHTPLRAPLAKHAHEHGFMPESCLPYTDPKHTKCSAACTNSDLYFSSPEYGYIGGYYGGSTEAGMMKELTENGPMVVALFAPRALFYYKSGILKVSEFDPKRGRQEDHWQETNHAVLVVGYGVDRTQAEPVKCVCFLLFFLLPLLSVSFSSSFQFPLTHSLRLCV